MAFVAIVIISKIAIAYVNQTTLAEVRDCKVITLQNQQLIKGSGSSMKTEIRYLVITDKETFVCESSVFNSKFDNSNIF